MVGEREPTVRQRRLGDLIARELSLVLQRRAQDPRLEAAIVTGVRATRDLRQATVYITTVAGQDRADVLLALQRSEAFLRREVAERVYLKYMPHLQFRADDSFDRGQRIDALLDQVSQREGASSESGDQRDEPPQVASEPG
jgi:ribosome-binding factor A